MRVQFIRGADHLILYDKLIEEFKSRNCELFHALLSQIEPKMLNKHFIMDSKWFVCSFSRNEDDQKLWDQYASGEAGCAIGFDPIKLLAWINGSRRMNPSDPTLSNAQEVTLNLLLNQAPTFLLPTYYDETVLRSFVKRIADAILIHWNNTSFHRSVEDYWAVWENQLSVVAPLFKNHEYECENELRLLHRLAPGEECKLTEESTTTRHLPLCYTEYFPIQRIIVAQCRNQELTNLSVENLKKAVEDHITHAYANRQIRPDVIRVSISKLPFQSQ
jgi:hypothetical protein